MGCDEPEYKSVISECQRYFYAFHVEQCILCAGDHYADADFDGFCICLSDAGSVQRPNASESQSGMAGNEFLVSKHSFGQHSLESAVICGKDPLNHPRPAPQWAQVGARAHFP